MLQTGVSTVIAFRCETHGSAIATAGARLLIVGTASVPGEADEDGPVATVVIVVLLVQARGNLVVDLLVVLLSRSEDLGGGRRGPRIEIVATSTGGDGTGGVEESRRARVLGRLGRVEATAAATLLAERLSGTRREGVSGGGAQSRAGELAGCC